MNTVVRVTLNLNRFNSSGCLQPDARSLNVEPTSNEYQSKLQRFFEDYETVMTILSKEKYLIPYLAIISIWVFIASDLMIGQSVYQRRLFQTFYWNDSKIMY